MYIKDLTRCVYFDWADGDEIYFKVDALAVGWIDHTGGFTSKISYRKGDVDKTFLKRLKEVIDDAKEFFCYMGWHDCALCEHSSITRDKQKTSWKNVFVPTKDKLYCCPELIVHYIEDHGYLPPQEFQDAVMQCPKFGSDEFWERIQQHSPDLWEHWLVHNKKMDYEAMTKFKRWFSSSRYKQEQAERKASEEREKKRRLSPDRLQKALDKYCMNAMGISYDEAEKQS